jgi:uncharacterized protein (TIGR02246 family)
MTKHAYPAAPSGVVGTLIGCVAELERSQREEDVLGFLALFSPDAVWVTGGGKRLIGLDEIREFTQRVLPGAFANGSVDYDVEHVSMISANVALTGVRQVYKDDGGQVTSRGLPSYVWREEEGTWRIVAGQNTAVPLD